MTEKISAIDTQEAGNHYKNQKVQPMELSYYLGATPAFCKLSKYIGRVKENQAEDLRKAYHCIELGREVKGKRVEKLNRIPLAYQKDIVTIANSRQTTLVKKGRNRPTEQQLRGMAFAIAKNISKRSIKPFPILNEASKILATKQFQSELKRAIVKDLKVKIKLP